MEGDDDNDNDIIFNHHYFNILNNVDYYNDIADY